jgi:hypothetical protein
MLHDHTSAMRNSPLNRLSQRPKVAPLLPRLLDARSPPGKVAIDPRFFTTRIEPMSLMDQASFARQSLAAIGATARDRNQDHDRYGSGPKAKRPRYDVRAPSAPLDVLASFVLKHHPRSLILRYNRFFTLRGWPLLAFSRLDRHRIPDTEQIPNSIVYLLAGSRVEFDRWLVAHLKMFRSLKT